MSGYRRVLPRDLFNEASLLKCYGKLWLALEGRTDAGFTEEDVESFDIVMDEADGSLTVRNLTLEIDGIEHRLQRPLNARGAWPLYLVTPSGEEISVFDDEGNLSEEMRGLLGT